VYRLPTDLDVDEYVSIGKPIANTQIYILDQHFNPVPIGVPGEMHIGGDGITRGYINRPRQTAERFVPDLFGDKPGARLYRTGDLARYLPDGNIEFLGRIDFQVKIRGYRIELGEIEAMLKQHTAVLHTVVLDQQNKSGETQLVAYLVCTQPPQATDLRAFLRKELPDYMLPTAFVFLDDIPLNRSGKTDRRALLALKQPQSKREDGYIAPATPTEERLATIWSDVLETEWVSIHDNFFDLGGHSLTLMRVRAAIETQFSCSVKMMDLFRYTTVQAQAQWIDTAQSDHQLQQPLPSATSQRMRTLALIRNRRKGE
jgi:aspartate racemase